MAALMSWWIWSLAGVVLVLAAWASFLIWLIVVLSCRDPARVSLLGRFRSGNVRSFRYTSQRMNGRRLSRLRRPVVWRYPTVIALVRPSRRRSGRWSNGEPSNELAVISDGVPEGRSVTRVIYGQSGFTLLDAEMSDADPDDQDVEELILAIRRSFAGNGGGRAFSGRNWRPGPDLLADTVTPNPFIHASFWIREAWIPATIQSLSVDANRARSRRITA